MLQAMHVVVFCALPHSLLLPTPPLPALHPPANMSTSVEERLEKVEDGFSDLSAVTCTRWEGLKCLDEALCPRHNQGVASFGRSRHRRRSVCGRMWALPLWQPGWIQESSTGSKPISKCAWGRLRSSRVRSLLEGSWASLGPLGAGEMRRKRKRQGAAVVRPSVQKRHSDRKDDRRRSRRS